MAGLVSGSALLDNPDIPAETREHLWASVRRELDRMERLLSKHDEPAAEIDLDEALGRILDLQHLKGRRVEYQSNGTKVRARYDALAEVVNILMDNAVTHGGTDSSVVEVVQRDDETVDIRVTDFGRGIPEDRRTRDLRVGREGQRLARRGHRPAPGPAPDERGRRLAAARRGPGRRLVLRHLAPGRAPLPRERRSWRTAMHGSARADHRVLIIDDHVLFAESLELALSLEGYDVRRLELPAEGGSMATLRSLALRANPRTVMLDLDLGRFGDGMNLDRAAGAGPRQRGRADRVGGRRAVGRLHASGSPQGAAQERRAPVGARHGAPAAPGAPVIGREELEALLDAWARDRQAHDDIRRRLDLLTPRERQVLGALIDGRTVRTISQDSVVSEATVRTQVKSILNKLEVSSQLAAVGMANQIGWRQGA